jgi:NADH-quinone oxidoreductase subunit L
VLGALLALVQTDIKKILAYSTLSNLALMFLALAAGSTGAGLMHLFGHAFFKALLFLAAGSVIMAAHHEQDVRKLKGVLKKLPVTNIAFFVGCLGGAGLVPYLAAGFFSKEAVLESLHEAEFSGFGISFSGHLVYWIVTAVELLSVLYLFRLYGYLRSDEGADHGAKAHGHAHDDPHDHGPVKETSPAVRIVLAMLIAAAPIFGWLSATRGFGGKGLIWNIITGGAEVPEGVRPDAHTFIMLGINIALAVVCFGIFSASKRREAVLEKLKGLRLGSFGPLSRKFYFDDVYAAVIVTPLKGAAYLSRLILENIFTGVITLAGMLGQSVSVGLRRFQTGKAHQYAVAVLLVVFMLAFWLGGR